jgi:hypothetical protein
MPEEFMMNTLKKQAIYSNDRENLLPFHKSDDLEVMSLALRADGNYCICSFKHNIFLVWTYCKRRRLLSFFIKFHQKEARKLGSDLPSRYSLARA